MYQSVSPYALLRASKPKPAAANATEYDLYSLSQMAPAQSLTPQPSAALPLSAAPAQQPIDAPPAKRSHYIADIHARHTSAIRRAPQSPASL